MSERLRCSLALVEPGRLACLLVLAYLVELAGLPVICWPGRLSGSASRATRSSHGPEQQRGRATPAGRVVDRLSGCAGAGAVPGRHGVRVERLALVEPGRLACPAGAGVPGRAGRPRSGRAACDLLAGPHAPRAGALSGMCPQFPISCPQMCPLMPPRAIALCSPGMS